MLSKKLLRARAASAVTVETDEFFENNLLLLSGDGTDGAANNSYVDEGTLNHTITVTGNPAQGAFSPYLETGYYHVAFDGLGDSISFPSNAISTYGTADYTIEFFFCIAQLPQSGSYYNIVDQRGATTGNSSIAITFLNNAGTYQFRVFLGNTVLGTGNFTPQVNKWYHAAWSKSSGISRLFVDGQQIISYATATAINTPFVTYIGSRHGTNDFFVGFISNVRIVKGTGLYSTTFTPPTEPLTAITNTVFLAMCCHRFRDISATNLSLTVIGNPKVKAGGPFNPPNLPNANYGSIYVDNANSYITTNNNASSNLSTTDFTIELWAYYRDNTAANAILFDQRNGVTSSAAPLIYLNTGNTIRFYVSGQDRIIGPPMPIGQWVHIAITRTGNSVIMYLNGINVGSATYNPNNSIYLAGPFRIGCDNDGSPSGFFNGYITGVRVSKGIRRYTANFTPSLAPFTPDSNDILALQFKNAAILDDTCKNNFLTAGNARLSTTVKKFGTASLFFDGTGDFIMSPYNNEWYLNTANWTLEYWCYPTTLSNAIRRHVSVEDSNNSICVRQNGDVIQAFLRFNSTTVQNINAAVNFTLNTWQHIALVRNGATITLYKNGVSIGSLIGQTGGINLLTSNVAIASSNSGLGEYYQGYIDEVRFTRGVARYTANFTPPIAPFPKQ